MTTFTIIDGEGEMIERGVSLSAAADAIMTSDSREWDIRADQEGGFTVWSRQQVANRAWAPTAIYSFATTREEAEREICEKIVGGERMGGHYEAMTDEAYDHMMAEFLSESED